MLYNHIFFCYIIKINLVMSRISLIFFPLAFVVVVVVVVLFFLLLLLWWLLCVFLVVIRVLFRFQCLEAFLLVFLIEGSVGPSTVSALCVCLFLLTPLSHLVFSAASTPLGTCLSWGCPPRKVGAKKKKKKKKKKNI